MNESITKMWYIHRIFSSSKRKEILTHPTTCMNLEEIMLNEIKQAQKDKYCMMTLMQDT
jgi:hypothetical protein